MWLPDGEKKRWKYVYSFLDDPQTWQTDGQTPQISDERINETVDSKVKYYGRCGQREHIDKFVVSSVSTKNTQDTADEWNQQHGVADKPTAAVTSDNQSCRPLLLAVWLSGNTLASINVVALRQTRLVLGWVTVCGRVNHIGM